MPGYPMPIFQVITPAADHDMADLEDIKDELSLCDGAADRVLKRYITEASAAAEQFCNRVFVVEDVQDRFFPERDRPIRIVEGGPDPLQLTRFPIVSLDSVTEDGIVLVAETDFTANNVLGQLIRLNENGYPRRWKSVPIVVQYEAGFDPVPTAVSAAIIRMVAQRYFAKGRDPNLRSEEIPGVYAASWWVSTSADSGQDGNLSPDVQSLLQNYRVPVIA